MTRVVTRSLSCLTSFVRISTVLKIALFVAIAAWAFSWCWRMEPLSAKLVNVRLGLGLRQQRRALGVACGFSSMSWSSSVEEVVEVEACGLVGTRVFGFGSSTSRTVLVSGSLFEYMGLACLLFFCKSWGFL